MSLRIVVFLGMLLFSLAMGKGWHAARDGFRIQRIRPSFSASFQEALFPSSSVLKALAQPYTYLARGRQCYAFVSRDGKYVLKFPRFDRYEVPFRFRALPFCKKKREEIRWDQRGRLSFLWESFQIAEKELSEETALLYAHLKQTHLLRQKVLLVDRIGRRFAVDLDQAAFLLQEKKPLMMPLFQACLHSGRREEAQEMLEAFLALVAFRSRKGIFNKDPTLLKNFGWDGARAMQVDIGSFYRDPSRSAIEAFRETSYQMRDSLRVLDPEICRWFEGRIEAFLVERGV